MNSNEGLGSNEEENDPGFGAELSFFVDRDAFVAFINEICSENWEGVFKDKFEWSVATLSKYQEQPTLLNPHLSEMLTPMTERMITIATSVAIDTNRTSLFEVRYFCFMLLFLILWDDSSVIG
jgi:hypothetical protein